MASRNFNRYQALEKEVKALYVEVSVGASGAPTLVSGLGIASISRTSAGLYRITLQDKYVRFLHASGILLESDAEDLSMQVKAQTVSSTKLVDVLWTAGGVATDPSSGSKMLIKIELKNTTAGE